MAETTKKASVAAPGPVAASTIALRMELPKVHGMVEVAPSSMVLKLTMGLKDVYSRLQRNLDNTGGYTYWRTLDPGTGSKRKRRRVQMSTASASAAAKGGIRLQGQPAVRSNVDSRQQAQAQARAVVSKAQAGETFLLDGVQYKCMGNNKWHLYTNMQRMPVREPYKAHTYSEYMSAVHTAQTERKVPPGGVTDAQEREQAKLRYQEASRGFKPGQTGAPTASSAPPSVAPPPMKTDPLGAPAAVRTPSTTLPARRMSSTSATAPLPIASPR